MPKQITPVIFRKWKPPSEGIVALFPAEAADYAGHISSYESTGGHGAANLAKVIKATVPASASEYAQTKRELEQNYGYRLRVIRKATGAHAAARRKMLPKQYANPIPTRWTSARVMRTPKGEVKIMLPATARRRKR